MQKSGIRIAWTTVESRKDALHLAHSLIKARLAACVQVDGPVQSVYPWKGAVETGEEYRLWIKYPANREPAIREWIAANHPYEVPQWIAVEAVEVAGNYAGWVREVTG